MQLQGKALRVTIYIGESDRFHNKALYMELLTFLKKAGASGATVSRGLAGFGARSRIHTAAILTLSEDLPLRLEWVDLPETVERLLPQVRQMVDDGLITVEEVNVVQYAPGRRRDPLAQPVRDVMRTEVVTVPPETPAAHLVSLLLQKGVRSVAVVDEAGHLLGIITDGDLLNRAGLASRLDLLSPTLWQTQISALRQQPETAVDLMTTPVVTVGSGEALRQAVLQMVAKDLKRLPVINPDNQLVGWISRVDVLRTLEYHQPLAEMNPEKPHDGSSISELMYQDIPVVDPQDGLEVVLQAMERNRRRRAVVVDADRRVLGMITDGDLLRRSQIQAHPGLLARLRVLVSGPQPPWSHLPSGKETAADLMTAPVITITLKTPLMEALRLMLKNQVKRLPVVDEDGRLLGLLGRASLLRGLLPSQAGE